MTLVLHVRTGCGCGNNRTFCKANPYFSEKEVLNHIHLGPDTDANGIRGKVQICNGKTISHYGIVVELRGTITFKEGPKNILHLFGVTKNSSSVLKSTVYHQICGDEDGLQKGDPELLDPKPKQFSLEAISHIFDFHLQLSTDRPLPPSMTSKYVDVKYEIIVYKRTQEEGYIPYGEGYRKILKFYGSNSPPPEISCQKLEEPWISQPFSGSGLEGCLQLSKSDYYRNEEIPFHVQILFGEKSSSIPVKMVSVFLLKTIIASYNFEEEVVEKYGSRSPTRSPNGRDFFVEGFFKGRRELASYNDTGASEDGGLRIVYTIKCEICTEEETIGGQMEVVIRTMNPIRSGSMEEEKDFKPTL